MGVMFIQKIRELLISHKYMLSIFTVLTFGAMLNFPGPSGMSNYITTPYLVSYEFGFGPRMFIGSVVDIFTDYVSNYFIWSFIIICTLLLLLLVSYYLEKVIENTENLLKYAVVFLVIVYLLSPASILYLSIYNDFGRFDLYLLLLTLIALLFAKHKCTALCIPVVCFICMAIHQIYLCTFAPLIVLILLYEVYQNKFSKYWLCILIVTVLTLCSSFIYFQFFAELNVSSVNELIMYIAPSTNLGIDSGSLDAAYFRTTETHFLSSFPTFETVIRKGLRTLLFLSPLFVLFLAIWIKTIRQTPNKREKIFYLICMLSPLAAFPAFIIAIDWGRWLAGLIIVQFAIIFYLMYHKDRYLLQSLRDMSSWAKDNLWALIPVMLYLPMLGYFREVTPLPILYNNMYLNYIENIILSIGNWLIDSIGQIFLII